jgi:hypothetical protein
VNTPNSYECPYCCSDVTLQASVCAHCGRDLLLFRPLAIQLQGLKNDVNELRASLEDLRLVANSPVLAGSDKRASKLVVDQSVATDWLSVALFVMFCLLGTGLAHWLLMFVYDVQPVLLRLVTILLPTIAASFFASRMHIGLRVHSIVSLLIAVLSVALMLGITSWIDDVSWWPQSARDKKEVFEYIASIALASWTGNYLYLLKLRQQVQAGLSHPEKQSGLEKKSLGTLVMQVKDAIENLTPIVSGGVALYSGLKAFLG